LIDKVGFVLSFATFKGGTLSIKSTSFARSAAIRAGPDLIGLNSTFLYFGLPVPAP
jgi:hypothetical protein